MSSEEAHRAEIKERLAEEKFGCAYDELDTHNKRCGGWRAAQSGGVGLAREFGTHNKRCGGSGAVAGAGS